jgi:AcrR family transcriptional regulator
LLPAGFGSVFLGRFGTVWPMSRDSDERQRLLSLTADWCLANGVGGLTLRALGQAIGTNNRMLLYYFGSKEQLIADALAEVMSRYPGIAGALDGLDRHDVALAERLDEGWRGLAAEPVPMRLFFEVFGLAAHHPGRFDSYLHVVGAVWIDRVVTALRADGVPLADARLLGREIVALWRGLQLDLVSGGDRRAVDATHRAAARSIAARAQGVRQPPRREVSSHNRPRASQAAP